MLLGAQFYSLRDHTQDAAGMEETFKEVADMGYECVQISGGARLSGEEFRRLSDTYGLPILTTHMSLDRLVNDTVAVIEEHKAFGAKQVGLSFLPPEHRDSLEAVHGFMEMLREPVKRIREAGLSFGYHNHHFEFFPLGDTCIYEILISETDWDFIPDVYWYAYAEKDPVEMLTRLRGRIPYIHLKDMAKEDRGIAVCGTGCIDFAPIVAAAEASGAQAAFIEQDNAPDLGDSYAQMREACRLIFPVVHHS